MKMSAELLIPRMQDHNRAHATAKVLSPKLEQGLAGRLEQMAEEKALVAQHEGVEFMRQRKDGV